MPEPMIPLGQFSRQVQQYDPVEVVLKCAATSRYMDKDNKTFDQEPISDTVAGFRRIRYALVTHSGLAAVVRVAIRNHPYARRKSGSAIDVMTLANNWNNVEDPFLGSGIMTLVRVAYEQFPYQEQLDELIPRYLTIWTETKPANPRLDIQEAFKRKTGLSIVEFMKIGVAFYSCAIHQASFTREFIEGTQAEKLQPFLTPEKVDAFLMSVAADFPAFRRLCLQEEQEAPGAGKWVFNPLISRPVITLPDGRFCVPIPRLLIQRITKGIYYDLQESFSTPDYNPFLEWFGHAFEEYGGIILRMALKHSTVHPEPLYGSPELGSGLDDTRAKDWPCHGVSLHTTAQDRPNHNRTGRGDEPHTPSIGAHSRPIAVQDKGHIRWYGRPSHNGSGRDCSRRRYLGVLVPRGAHYRPNQGRVAEGRN
jgi:hypothetical protein